MATTTVKTVTIAGISGKLGRLIAKSVLNTSEANVRGFCRDKAKVPTELSSAPRVTLIEGASNDLQAARQALHGSDVVICSYLGPNDLMVDGQKVLIDAAEAEKVPRYIASDWALDYTKLALGDLPLKDPMIQIKAYLESKTIKGVHILNGAFMEVLQMAFQRDPAGYWGTGDEKWDLTTYATSAEYTAAIALDSEASGVIKVRGDLLSFKEAAKIIEKHSGKPVNIKQQGSLSDLRRLLDDAKAKGDVPWPTLVLFYVYFMSSGQTALGDDLANDWYPWVKPETFEAVVAAQKNK